MSTAPDTRTIARAIRTSSVLDEALKKHWLAVLPHLTPEDRRQLWTILNQAEQQLRRVEKPTADEQIDDTVS